VTPSSKVVGDLALHLVAVNADPADFAANPQNYDIPDSVVGFMAGELGDLPGGWPEPFRTKVLQGKNPKFGLVAVSPDDLQKLVSEDAKEGVVISVGQWWPKLSPDRKSLNDLTSERLTDLGGGSTFGNPVVHIGPVC
jgi:hypothetical protein